MKKNILILSYADNRGDGIAAYDLAKCLIELGYETALMVLYKTRQDNFIIQPTFQPKTQQRPNLLLRLKNKVFKKKIIEKVVIDSKYDFFLNQELNEFVSTKEILDGLTFIPDLILAASVHDLVNTTNLYELKIKTRAKVYMLMMDMAPLTGGCQHSWDCNGYKNDCNNCPAILSLNFKQAAYNNLRIKAQNVKKTDIDIIALSARTFEQAKSSSLFKNQKIFNVNSFIDLKVYNNNNRKSAKSRFNLPSDRKIIFAGSEYYNNERKGFKYLVEALKIIWDNHNNLKEKIGILLIGKRQSGGFLENEIFFDKFFIDFIEEENLLSLAYQASDIFICTSIEDAGPRMVSQALACGTPVVGFEMGILINLVHNNFNGYKAELKNSNDLAFGILEILSLSEDDYSIFSNNAVEEIKNFSSIKTVEEVFNKILES